MLVGAVLTLQTAVHCQHVIDSCRVLYKCSLLELGISWSKMVVGVVKVNNQQWQRALIGQGSEKD